jgi:hypothetical protein
MNQSNITNSCWFCYSKEHSCRECPLEFSISNKLRNKAGNDFEDYIANNIKCPGCLNLNLKRLNNHSPSLDIICSCGLKFEIKSKCLSIKELPNDIQLNHGSYIDCIDRINNESLNLILIIYGVNRIQKEIYIREILYANNSMLKNTKLIEIRPIVLSNKKVSKIFIKNRNFMGKMNMGTLKHTISFKQEVDNYVIQL